MIKDLPLLSMLIWLPIAGAALVLLLGGKERVRTARWIALSVTLLSLLLCVPLYLGFDTGTAHMQFVEHMSWIPSYRIDYYLGVDGISLPLIILSCFTTLIVILSSWELVTDQIPMYLATFLIMQGMVVGVFASLDSILFYFFWEGMLIPMYLSIGIWGAQNRSYAAIKFFMYTFFGSAILLVALIYLRMQTGSFDILSFFHTSMAMPAQIFIFIAFLLAFGIKIPMWPVHTWLPDAHTEAPAGGSVVLAALMLKLGAYGILRFMMPIVPDACRLFMWPMIGLSLIAIIYMGFMAYVQTDMKRLIAYSSVAHMGFVTLGCFMVYLIFANTHNYASASMAMEGGMVQMITHAFGSGAMFLAFGILYHQMHTRLIKNFGGIATTMPVFAAFFMLFVMTNIGLPGTAGFVGEFMIILAAFKANIFIAIAAGSSLIIGAVYSLWMYRRVFYGAVTNPHVSELKDIGPFNKFIFLLLAVCILGLGFYPNALLHVIHASVGNLLHQAMASHLPITV